MVHMNRHIVYWTLYIFKTELIINRIKQKRQESSQMKIKSYSDLLRIASLNMKVASNTSSNIHIN